LATGLCPDPLGELIALPKSLDEFKGHTSKGRGGGERKEVRGSERREVEREGKSGEGGVDASIRFRKLLKT